MKRKKKIYDVSGFGISTLDYICTLENAEQLNDVSFISDFRLTGGGIVPTALVALQRLGMKTTFMTTVGDDWIGRGIVDELEREGADCSGTKTIRGFIPV
jgi:sugar/nucleoside kinase (ribokinase family)